VKDWERREAEMHKEFCRSRLVDEQEQDEDELAVDEREMVEAIRRQKPKLYMADMLAIIDRLAPKPAPKETVEDVLAEMRSARGKNFGYGETVRLHLEVHDWANRIEAALKGGAR
jgi:F0F1-type ATP synthase membrane subunit b/b'